MALFTARQPIFNKKLEVIAYELIYRDDQNKIIAEIEGSTPALKREKIKAMMLADYTQFGGKKKVYFAFDDNLLAFEVPLSFDAQKLIVEIDRDVELDEDIIDRLSELKKRGYEIALKYFGANDVPEELMPYVDMMRVDFSVKSKHEVQDTVEFAKLKKYKLIADNIYTPELYEEAKAMGFDYFKGGFYAVPNIVHNKVESVISNTYVRLINEWNKELPDNKVLANIVISDASLSFKLLKLLNSAAFYRQTRINSVHTAIVTLGDVAFKKWLLLLMLNDVMQTKADELVNNSVLRAKFMELVWIDLNKSNYSADSAFLVGMFSMLDVILGRGRESIMQELPVVQEVKDAIIHGQNDLGDLLELIRSIERTDLEDIRDWCEENSYSVDKLFDRYSSAVLWSTMLMESQTE